MYGYVFLTENKETGKKYIGIHRAVSFDNKYFGEEATPDVEKYGASKFSVKMLMPYESEKALVESESYWREKYEVTAEEEKPKKGRRKKAEDE
jgi:hypothetical protein